MGSPVRTDVLEFSQWADRARAKSRQITKKLFKEGDSSQPLSFIACNASCCALLRAIDRDNLGRECCDELVRVGVYRALSGAITAEWEVISEALLVERVGTQACDSAWLEQDPEESMTSVRERLRLASCSSEVAVLMLRLAVRAACLASSWHGPWDNMRALRQLINAKAWSSLHQALSAMLTCFGPYLAMHYNALNIVSDILHIFYCLGEGHTLKDITPSSIGKASGLPQTITDTAFLVMKHAEHLPPLHRQQAAQGDTALLMVPSLLMLAITATKTKAGQSPVHIFFNDFTEVRTLIAESLAGVESGRLPGDLGDTAEALDTGCVKMATSLLLYVDLMNHSFTRDSFLCLPWRRFCEQVPLQKITSLIDQWLLSSEDGSYDPSSLAGKQSAHRMHLALQLLRMVSRCRSSGGSLRGGGLVLRCVHLLRHLLAGPLAARYCRQKLWRPPAEPGCMPSPSSWGHNQLLMSLLEGTSCIADFLGCFWRPCELPCQHNLSGFPSHSVGTGRSALYDEECHRKTWARYDNRVEAVLDMGAAGVLESLLRSIHRTSYRKERLIYVAQIHHNSAMLLAHTMLHHPRAWPKQTTALGLLITLRKFIQIDWMKLPWDTDLPYLAMLPIALLSAIVRKEVLLPEHTAAFAATQLLPVIQAATNRHLASMPRQQYHLLLCKELLMMCSYLAASSAWPVLLGHRDLITLAADTVLYASTEGFPAYMYQQATRMLDTACIHAAACDMAIADAGFRAAASPSNLSMMTALCGIFERAEAEFPKGREAAGLLALMDFQFGRLALSTGFCALPSLKEFISTVESAQSTVLDWRRIDFWRNSSFAADWAAFKRREMKMPTDPAVINSLSEDKAEAILDPRTGRPVPSAWEKAASELLQARSLLLAGEAGLCCNPGCTEMSGRHERSLRTLRCGGGCHHGRFCSRACLKEAWPVHRLVCRESTPTL